MTLKGFLFFRLWCDMISLASCYIFHNYLHSNYISESVIHYNWTLQTFLVIMKINIILNIDLVNHIATSSFQTFILRASDLKITLPLDGSSRNSNLAGAESLQSSFGFYLFFRNLYYVLNFVQYLCCGAHIWDRNFKISHVSENIIASDLRNE